MEDKRVYGVYFTTKSAHEKVDTLFNSLHFVRVRIESSPAGSVDEAVAGMTARAEAAVRDAERLQGELEALKDSEQEKLLNAFTFLRYHKECCDIRRFAACSRETFYLTGWVPQTEVPALMEKLKAEGSLSYVLDEGKHIPLSTPPTKLRHGPLGKIFQPFWSFTACRLITRRTPLH